MIFVTVGTHEDPFDRLVNAVDDLVSAGQIDEPVLVQHGYGQAAKYCETHAMMPFEQVQRAMSQARIVVTHGGPASIMQVLAADKIPIVVPRQPAFGEHVDGHQLAFARRMADRVIVVVDIDELGSVLSNYDALVAQLPQPDSPRDHADAFSDRLETVIQQLLAE